MEPTGNPSEIAKLNELLGQELGRNPYGESVFSWRWSEKCLWPGTRTGRTIKTEKRAKVQLIGGGEEDVVIEEIVPEYKIDRQLGRLRDAWLICKWLHPWELITGPTTGHMRYGVDMENKPPDEAVEASWKLQYPGMDFPGRGWRIPLGQTWDQANPSRPPDLQDTRSFIRLLRAQVALTFDQAMAQFDEGEKRHAEETEKGIGEIARDGFPAFLNDQPGKRGGWVSMPFTRFDKHGIAGGPGAQSVPDKNEKR